MMLSRLSIGGIGSGLTVVLVALGIGCTKRELGPAGFIAVAVDTSGPLCITKQYGEFTVRLFYRPPEYFLAEQMLQGILPAQDTAFSAQEGICFMLRIGKTRLRDGNEGDEGWDRVLSEGAGRAGPLFLERCVSIAKGRRIAQCAIATLSPASDPERSLDMVIMFGRQNELGAGLWHGELTVRDFGLNVGTMSFGLRQFHRDRFTLKRNEQ